MSSLQKSLFNVWQFFPELTITICKCPIDHILQFLLKNFEHLRDSEREKCSVCSIKLGVDGLQLTDRQKILFIHSLMNRKNTFIENIWSAQARKFVTYKTKIAFGIARGLNKDLPSTF